MFVEWPIKSFGLRELSSGGTDGLCLSVSVCVRSQHRGCVCRRPAVRHPLSVGEDRNPQLVSREGGSHWYFDLFKETKSQFFISWLMKLSSSVTVERGWSSKSDKGSSHSSRLYEGKRTRRTAAEESTRKQTKRQQIKRIWNAANSYNRGYIGVSHSTFLWTKNKFN